MLRNFVLLLLAGCLTVGLLSSCDDDDVVVVDSRLILVDKTTGMWYAINTTNGNLTPLDSIVYNGEALKGIRDIVFNPDDGFIYLCQNGHQDGKIFKVDPETLQATLINDNADEDWDAVAELVISNGKLLGTTYLNEPEYGHGLITIEFTGTQGMAYDFVDAQSGLEIDTDCGFGLAFGDNEDQLVYADEDNVYISNLSGEVSEGIDLAYVDFQPMGMYDFCITSLEKDDDGVLFGLTSDGHFVRIDLAAETMTLIDELSMNENQYHGLSNIPEDYF